MNQNADFENNAVLVEEIQKGNALAEDALVNRFGPGIWWALKRETRSEEDRQDLYQETLLKALANIRSGKIQDPDKLGSYLLRTAQLMAIGFYRKQTKTNESSLDESGDYGGHGDSGPLSGIIREQSAKVLRALLKELGSERDRTILTRFYIEEEDKILICTDLGLTALQFNRVIHRAKQRFREIYEKKFGNPFRPSVRKLRG